MRTQRLLALLLGAFLTGNMAGCSNQAAFPKPQTPPPHVAGYDDRYWVWDEEDGEWDYEPPGGGGHFFYYGGMLHRSSIRTTPGFKSFSSSKSSSSSKFGGFGSGSRGGGFGG